MVVPFFSQSKLIKLHRVSDKTMAHFASKARVIGISEEIKYVTIAMTRPLKREFIDGWPILPHPQASISPIESIGHKSKNSSVSERLHDFLMKCCCLVLHAHGFFIRNVPLN